MLFLETISLKYMHAREGDIPLIVIIQATYLTEDLCRQLIHNGYLRYCRW